MSAKYGSMDVPSYVLTSDFCSDRFLPDKAIDLIDEAGSKVRLKHAQVLIQTILPSCVWYVTPCVVH